MASLVIERGKGAGMQRRRATTMRVREWAKTYRESYHDRAYFQPCLQEISTVGLVFKNLVGLEAKSYHRVVCVLFTSG